LKQENAQKKAYAYRIDVMMCQVVSLLLAHAGVGSSPVSRWSQAARPLRPRHLALKRSGPPGDCQPAAAGLPAGRGCGVGTAAAGLGRRAWLAGGVDLLDC